MNITEITYQNVYNATQKFAMITDADSQRRVQKIFFQTIANFYSHYDLTPALSFDKEVYYYQAQQIAQGKDFQSLFPCANTYCAAIGELASLVQTSPEQPPENLKTVLEKVKRVHTLFANQFIPEYKKKVSLKEASALFVDSFLPYAAEFKSAIECQNPELFTYIPTLAIEYLLRSNEERLPEFFSPIASELPRKRKTYQGLSAEEQENLRKTLLGEEAALQPVTKELFKSIHQLSTTLKKDPQINSVFQYTFIELARNS